MAIAPPTNEVVPNAQPVNELETDEVSYEDALSALQSFAGDCRRAPSAKSRFAQGEASEDDDNSHDGAEAPPPLRRR